MPENLGAAAGMFQCKPTEASSNLESVVVWTDSVNKVVAFGAAREGTPLPAYATALGGAEIVDVHQPMHVAVEGHVMQTLREKSVLRLKDTELACIRTWDD